MTWRDRLADAVSDAAAERVTPVAGLVGQHEGRLNGIDEHLQGIDATLFIREMRLASAEDRIAALEAGTPPPEPEPDPEPDPDPDPEPEPSIQSVTLDPPTETSVVVRIALSEPAPARSWYREVGTETWLAGPNETSSNHQDHVQTISGLSPATQYEVRAEAFGTSSATHVVTTLGAQQPTEPEPPPPPPPPPPSGVSYPSVVTTQRVMALSPFSKPPRNQSVPWPAFGTRVRRVTEGSARGHAYPSRPAWSIDGSVLMLVRGVKQLLRADLSHLANHDMSSLAIWSCLFPTRLYAPSSANSVRQYEVNPATGAVSSTTWGFSPPNGAYSSMDFGGGQGKCSLDDRISLHWVRGNQSGIATLDLVSRQVVWERVLGSASADFDYSIISWSGRYHAIANHSPGETSVIDSQTGTKRQFAGTEEHSDTVQDSAGDDWLVIKDGSQITARRCVDGLARRLAPLSGSYNGGHVSGTNYRRPGWVYLSQQKPNYGNVLGGQLVAVSIDDPSDVEVFGQQHGPGDSYEAEPHITAHPLGHQVIWRARWDGESAINAYVAGVGL